MSNGKTYEEACTAAATAQGLDPVSERLTAEGITHHIAQTGGFTMVLVVPVGERMVCVTRDGLDPERPYLVGEYTAEAWAEGGEEDADHFNQSLAEVVEIVRSAEMNATMREQIASAVPCGECGEIGHNHTSHDGEYSAELAEVLRASLTR